MKLAVSASPHVHSGASARRIMLDVIIALVPALVAAVYLFGPRALLLTLVTVAAAVLSERISRHLMRRDSTIGDLSAVVTGLILALNLPSTLPFWMAILGAVVAVVIAKQFFGGLGQNFANPAVVGRLMLVLSFPVYMTAAFAEPLAWRGTVDAVSSATPLFAYYSGQPIPGLRDLFFGIHAGSMGETSAFALLLGGAYLMIRRVISPIIPIAVVGTVLIIAMLGGHNPLFHLLSGGLLLGAIFMATDYATSPITRKGKLIFGVGVGLITVVIRLFAALPEGISFGILLMNILVPHIERLTMKKPFGYRKES